MFKINPFKTSREENVVPNNHIKASVRKNPITISQPHVITKKDVNSHSNGLSSTGVNITTKTRRPQPRSNTKNDRVPLASKSSWIKNKEVEVEEHHRNLLLSKNKKHMSSKCNNIKLAIQNDKSEVVCDMSRVMQTGNGGLTAILLERGCLKDDALLEKHLPRLHESAKPRIKFSTCTLLAGALTWWNSHVRIVGHDVAYAMTWTDLRKKMTDKYCPRNEMKKLEAEMFPEESDKVERYVGGLPDMIHGSVVASKPKTMQEATEMATELMDKKISTFAERQAENKRKLDNNHQAQQQLPKRQNVVQAYAAGTGERKEYAGTLPLQKATCYECGNQGHYKRDCPERKNQNHENQIEGTEARGMVYAFRGGETEQDINNIEDEIEA
ncbi:reverse transcriptase domain-containing protein [Tanacetum coccineum]